MCDFPEGEPSEAELMTEGGNEAGLQNPVLTNRNGICDNETRIKFSEVKPRRFSPYLQPKTEVQLILKTNIAIYENVIA